MLDKRKEYLEYSPAWYGRPQTYENQSLITEPCVLVGLSIVQVGLGIVLVGLDIVLVGLVIVLVGLLVDIVQVGLLVGIVLVWARYRQTTCTHTMAAK